MREAQKPELAVVVRGYHKHGGISRCAAELAKAACQDYSVSVVTDYFESNCADLKHVPVRARHCPRLKRFDNSLAFASFALRANRVVRRSRFDLVHTHSTACLRQDIVTAHSCHVASVFRLRRLQARHTGLIQCARIVTDPFFWVNYLIEHYQYSRGHFRRIIAVSSSVKHEIVKYFRVQPDLITVIPNGVELDRFHADPLNRARMRLSLGIRESDVVVLFLSNRYQDKGIEVLIEAVARCSNPAVKLLVVCGDPNPEPRQGVERLGIQQRVIFAGATVSPELFYQAADVFALPSLYEGFGLVYAEAMACALPVMATRVGIAPDLVRDGCDGFLFDVPAAVGEITARLDALASDANLRRTMGAASLERALEFSWGRIAAATMALYAEMREGNEKNS